MIGFDITRLISIKSGVYKNLYGLVSIEEVPRRLNCHEFVIVHHQNHWMVLHRNLIGHYEFFNSLGTNLDIINKVKNRLSKKANLSYNSTQLQSDQSGLCGEFTVYYTIMGVSI